MPQEGWLIAPGQWYELRQESERANELRPEKKYIVVNTMIRLEGVDFIIRKQGGPQQRSLRGWRGALSFLSQDMHNMILACV